MKRLDILIPTIMAILAFIWGLVERLRGFEPSDQVLMFLIFAGIAVYRGGK